MRVMFDVYNIYMNRIDKNIQAREGPDVIAIYYIIMIFYYKNVIRDAHIILVW